MAFTSFYLVAGGTGAADINAGSSTGAAQVTTTNGNWNSGTGAFVAASPAFGSTVVGDYASVYVDGATVTTYVAKVKTVTDSTHIVVDTTIAYGTAPSTSATARSCTINGAWNTEQVLAAGGLATFTVPQSTKINITGNLTLSTSRTISMAGAAATPLWFSGYHTNPGDLDNDTTNTLSKPIWTVGANLLTWSGAQQRWSGLSFTGNRNGNFVSFTSSSGICSRCRFDNTNSGTSTNTILNNGANQVYLDCWFQAPSTATVNGVILINQVTSYFDGCVAAGGGLCGFNIQAQQPTLVNCVALPAGNGAGFLSSTGGPHLRSCTVYNAVDGIKWTGAPTAGSTVVGCLFSGVNSGTAMTNGINSAGGTTNNITRGCNDYYNVTNPEVGLGDSPALWGQTDSNPVVTSATNLTPVTSSNAINNGFPGIFENGTYSSYLAIGAVQPIGGGLVPLVFE